MKKVKGLTLSLGLLMILAACGQGETNSEDANNNVSGTDGSANETELNENDELNENENENGNEDEEANESTPANENNMNEDVEEHQVNNEEENSVENNLNESMNDEGNYEEEIDNEENNAKEEDEIANEENTAVEDDEATMIDSVTLYFSDDQLLNTYRVQSDVSVTDDESGAMQAMELWAAGPTHDGLYSLLPQEASVEFVKFHGDTAHVSFSEDLNEANLGSSGELMFTEQVALMMEQFGFDQTQILIVGNEVGEFLGHMDLSDPITAGNPEDYEWME
ncbi:GerMN domain-containing protein [Salipaludibacillus keqinensis]|nr:GerMN domain-containing protein [Salipaludibacillus keqinensis]